MTTQSAAPDQRVSRRTLLTGATAVAGVALVAPTLTGCDSRGTGDRPDTTGADALRRALPRYQPSTAVTADIPGTPGANGSASDPAFLSYPANPAHTVAGSPDRAARTPPGRRCGGRSRPSSGNAYYEAVNAALGTNLKIQPADGNNYVDSRHTHWISRNELG
jgi:putative aldouronate transport system substrate-binding protein